MTRLPILLCVLPMMVLTSCTTYTYPDRDSETVWGVPTEDETLTREERENAPPRYREPGEAPETR